MGTAMGCGVDVGVAGVTAGWAGDGVCAGRADLPFFFVGVNCA